MEGAIMKTLTRRRALVVRDDYLNLVRRFPLRPIRGEAEYDAAAQMIDELALRNEGTLSPGEQDYLDAITEFVEAYDREHYQLDLSGLSAVQIVRHLMESSDMKPADLGRILGSRSAATQILNGHRQLSKAQMLKLAAHFKVDGGLFLRG
jgi:HTH-type transcriptional regulator / antitoxin HigA